MGVVFPGWGRDSLTFLHILVLPFLCQSERICQHFARQPPPSAPWCLSPCMALNVLECFPCVDQPEGKEPGKRGTGTTLICAQSRPVLGDTSVSGQSRWPCCVDAHWPAGRNLAHRQARCPCRCRRELGSSLYPTSPCLPPACSSPGVLFDSFGQFWCQNPPIQFITNNKIY